MNKKRAPINATLSISIKIICMISPIPVDISTGREHQRQGKTTS